MRINNRGEIENKELYSKSNAIMWDIFTFGPAVISLSLGCMAPDVLAPIVFAGFVMALLGFLIHSEFHAQYEVERNGVWAKYPLEGWELISWDAFQEVCVCYAVYGGDGGAYVFICFVKHGQKTDMYGRWKAADFYHHREVITLDYTYELHDQVKEFCPYEVKDLRMDRRYKLRIKK